MIAGVFSSGNPSIVWKHIDGPLLICRDGTIHWLTTRERIWMKLGLTNIDQLETKYMRIDQRG